MIFILKLFLKIAPHDLKGIGAPRSRVSQPSFETIDVCSEPERTSGGQVLASAPGDESRTLRLGVGLAPNDLGATSATGV